jgi:cyclopropane-fatty-acyl-phospholipid synthase
MVLHAAKEHGVRAVGVTLSKPQADLARKRAAELGVGDLVEIRHADYRDVHDGPYDAISSIGMFEHVGLMQLGEYFTRCYALLNPGARFLNHGISRPAHMPTVHHTRFARRGLSRDFTERYVFPDGELHEIGDVMSAMQNAGFEARHMESLREHYALTLRAWVRNLEADWDRAIEEAGAGRARVWRLYMAAAAVAFEKDRNEVHQILALQRVPARQHDVRPRRRRGGGQLTENALALRGVELLGAPLWLRRRPAVTAREVARARQLPVDARGRLLPAPAHARFLIGTNSRREGPV